MDLLISFINNYADMFTVALYFNIMFGKARETISAVSYWVIFILSYSVGVFVQNMLPRHEIIILLLLTIGVSFVYEVKISWRIIMIFLYQVIAMLSEIFSYGLFVWIIGKEIAWGISESWGRAMLFVAKLVTLLIIIIISIVKKSNREGESLAWRYQIILALITAWSIATILYEGNFHGENLEKENYQIYVVSLLLLFINLIVYKLIDFVVEITEEQHKKEKMEFLIRMQQEKYDEISNSFVNVNRIIHDVNKHLQFIHFCIEEKEYKNAQEYLENVENDLKKQYERVYTGNLAIDAIVSNAVMKAKEEGITVITDIRMQQGSVNVEHYDICIVLGNLIENALEAVRKINELNKRYIEIHAYTGDCGLVFEIINTISEEIVPDFSNTSKKNENRHGYGMKNIQSVVEKYGGNLKFRVDEGKVFVVAYIPFKEN